MHLNTDPHPETDLSARIHPLPPSQPPAASAPVDAASIDVASADTAAALRQRMIDSVMREIDEADTLDAQIARVLARGNGVPGSDHSIVFSLRLDSRELAALRVRAEALRIGPTMLARDLIRSGVRGRPEQRDIAAEIERLDASVEALRRLLVGRTCVVNRTVDV